MPAVAAIVFVVLPVSVVAVVVVLGICVLHEMFTVSTPATDNAAKAPKGFESGATN